MKKLIKVSALLGILVTSVNLNTYGEELNRHRLNSDLEETINTLQLEYPNEWNNPYLSQKEQNERLDIFASLAHVNYTAMFTKNEGENSGYHAIVYISDTYDFEEMDSGTYDNFEIEFGNNYCYLAQIYGYIMPFKINIYYSFG